MQAETVRFDESSRCSLSDKPVGPGGITHAIRQATESHGIDATSELYNEALRYATEGHLRHSRERLQILLGLSPEDGEARLLLAKVYVAGQRWRDALTAIDQAQACGIHVPSQLREAIEESLAAEVAGDEERLQTLQAREQGELKALRQEARRLRSENAQLLGRNYDLEKEARRWAWTTAGVSGVAILFVAVNLLFGGSGSSSDTIAATEPVEVPSDAIVSQPSVQLENDVSATAKLPTPPANNTLADQAAAALTEASSLRGTSLTVTVQSGKALLSGQVASHVQKKDAQNLILGIPGISDVSVDDVKVAVRKKGTKHTVVSGDSLSKLAYDYYGDATLAKRIQRENKRLLKGRANLSIGMDLAIPPVD